MLRRVLKNLSARAVGINARRNFKVAVVGAGGGIGQLLSLLLKQNKYITELNLYDVVHIPTIATDLSHIDTMVTVNGFLEDNELPKALDCANIVVIFAGKGRKPGMSRDDLFGVNSNIIIAITEIIADICPQAMIAIGTNPVNSIIPIAAEVLKKKGVHDPRRLFGITTLDIIRAKTFIGEALKVSPYKVIIPVIGGHSADTMVPLFSKCKPEYRLTVPSIKKLTNRIQNAGTEIVKAKVDGSATIATAHAAERFTTSLLRGLAGEKNVVDYSYVESYVSSTLFFASALELGPNGIEDYKRLPPLDAYEEDLICTATPILEADIKKGIKFATRLEEE